MGDVESDEGVEVEAEEPTYTHFAKVTTVFKHTDGSTEWSVPLVDDYTDIEDPLQLQYADLEAVIEGAMLAGDEGYLEFPAMWGGVINRVFIAANSYAVITLEKPRTI